VTTSTLTPRPDTEGKVAVDPRIQARRDEVDRSRRRRRRLQVAVVAGLLALAGLVYLVAHSPLLDVDRVLVSGTDHVPTDEILQTAGVAPGAHLVDVDPGTVRHRLLALPWVADAEVGVDWPAGNVHIAVTERVPVAAVPDGTGSFTLVDATGHAIVTVPPGDPGLVTIEGLAPVEPGSTLGAAAEVPLQIITALQPGLRSRIVSVVVAPDGTLQLKALPPGVIVRLCTPDAIESKLRSLTSVFAQVDDTDMATVDVCVPESPVVTRTPKAP